MVLDEAVLTRIRRILAEQHHLDRLKSHALRPRQSLLLTGPPGCGKTLTASAISGAVGRSEKKQVQLPQTGRSIRWVKLCRNHKGL